METDKKYFYLTKFILVKRVIDILLAIKYDNKVKPFPITIPKMNKYVKNAYKAKYKFLLIKDDELLKKQKGIWNKTSYKIEKEFDSEPIHNDKYIKIKIKSYNGTINKDFNDNEMPKDDSLCICFSIILTDSFFKMSKNYCPQVFLKEYNHSVKKRMMKRCFNSDYKLITSSDKSDELDDSNDTDKSQIFMRDALLLTHKKRQV